MVVVHPSEDLLGAKGLSGTNGGDDLLSQATSIGDVLQ